MLFRNKIRHIEMTNDTYSIQTPELPARTNPENVNAPPLPERNVCIIS